MTLSPAMQNLIKHGPIGPPAPPAPPAPPPQSIEVDGVTITKHDMIEYYLSRAMSAYARSGGTDQPSSHLSTVCTYRGRSYVRLANINGPLAVYRITNSIYGHKGSGGSNFRLQRLTKWHKAVFTAPEVSGIYF